MGKARLLLVDDDFETLDCLKEELEARYHITLASTGDAALSAIAHEHFDAIILDLRMPGTDGFDVLAQLSKAPDHPPVIVASAMPRLDRVAARYGAQGWLVKPYSLGDLEGQVRRLSSRSVPPAP